MTEKRIFVVDDEAHIRELLEYNLENNGYAVTGFEDALTMLVALKSEIPDAIILDLMLPKLSGIDACKMIREDAKTQRIPVIMLTAKNQEVDKVLGLELGADDYITKPFSVKELLARLRAVMRRFDNAESGKADEKAEASILRIQDLVIDLPKHEVTKAGQSLILTYKEFELLHMLVENAPNVLTRDMLLNKVWGYDYYGDTRTVDVHIKNLRKILGDKTEKYIMTVRGVGYKFHI